MYGKVFQDVSLAFKVAFMVQIQVYVFFVEDG